MAKSALWRQLSISDSLTRSGDRTGPELSERTVRQTSDTTPAECRPQGNLLENYRRVLRGGPDAGQAASQAVNRYLSGLHVSPRDRGALELPCFLRTVHCPAHDPRLPELLRQLLDALHSRLGVALQPDETERNLADLVAVVRLLDGLGAALPLVATPTTVRSQPSQQAHNGYQITRIPFRFIRLKRDAKSWNGGRPVTDAAVPEGEDREQDSGLSEEAGSFQRSTVSWRDV